MIVRIVLALFVSIVSGVCYLSGLLRLMSGLLIGFGVGAASFFGILFLLPPGDDRLSFAVSGPGNSWPFFLLAFAQIALVVWLFTSKTIPSAGEQFASRHLKYLLGAVLLYLGSLFTPILFWFPSAEEMKVYSLDTLGQLVLVGVALYLVGTTAALYLLYRAGRGATEEHPDLMRRFVLAMFSVFHFDKMPALVAYLLVFSSEPELVFPAGAALALAGYLPVGIFLVRMSLEDRKL